MDHSNKNNQQHHLGVNKISKAIRKSPLHQPTYHQQQQQQQQQQRHPPPPSQLQQNQPAPQPQPQVYNISKNDFRSIVQQLTGTPSRDPAPPPPSRPPHPKPPSMRLQKIRPPPLTPIARPPPPPFQNPMPMPMPMPMPNPNPSPNPNLNPAGFFPRPSPIAVSPVSAYMRYLESSLLHSDGRPPVPSPGLLPPPPFPAFPSPRGNPNPNHQYPNQQHPGSLPSPVSQFVPPSPSSFLNLLSPKSPYPLLSPGFQYPPPLTPNFSFSPLSPGIWGPGPGSHPPPPPSPGLLFPPSPSGFFPILSPRWRDM